MTTQATEAPAGACLDHGRRLDDHETRLRELEKIAAKVIAIAAFIVVEIPVALAIIRWL